MVEFEGGGFVAGEGGGEVGRDLDDGAEAFIGDAGAPVGGGLDEANLVVGGEFGGEGGVVFGAEEHDGGLFGAGLFDDFEADVADGEKEDRHHQGGNDDHGEEGAAVAEEVAEFFGVNGEDVGGVHRRAWAAGKKRNI